MPRTIGGCDVEIGQTWEFVSPNQARCACGTIYTIGCQVKITGYNSASAQVSLDNHKCIWNFCFPDWKLISNAPLVTPTRVYRIEAETYEIPDKRYDPLGFDKTTEFGMKLYMALKRRVSRMFREWPYCMEHNCTFHLTQNSYNRPKVTGELKCPKC